jgi:hypothetical protein
MSAQRSAKPWRTVDFENKFQQAMGRQMTPKEREFFGLEPKIAIKGEHGDAGAPINNRAQFAWEALRRVSSLIG